MSWNCFYEFFIKGKKTQFFSFQAEIKILRKREHTTSQAELKILMLELWLKPARLGLITSILPLAGCPTVELKVPYDLM